MEYSEGIVNAIMVPSPSSQMWTGAVIAIICSLSFLPNMYPAILRNPPLEPRQFVPSVLTLAWIVSEYLLTSNPE